MSAAGMTSVSAVEFPKAGQCIGQDGFRCNDRDEAGDRHLGDLNPFSAKDLEVVAKRDEHAADYPHAVLR